MWLTFTCSLFYMLMNYGRGQRLEDMEASFTSREHAFHPPPLVPGPTAKDPGGGGSWERPGWSHQPGQKVHDYSRLVVPTRTNGARHS
jgi:hypothetical protein